MALKITKSDDNGDLIGQGTSPGNRISSESRGALECNLTGTKNLQNLFRKKNLHFDTLFRNY